MTSYTLVPMGYDDNGERLHVIAVADLLTSWGSIGMAESVANKMLAEVPGCILVRIKVGERILKEVKR